MDWPETVELTLDGIAQGGEGVGRWQGRVVFVRGGLPGERVQVQLRERRDSYARGDVLQIIEASPDRVPPRLPGIDSMPWQHIAYPAQLRFKYQILTEQLAKIGGLVDIAVAETLPVSRPWAYRNNARFHCDGVRVGYYAAESHDIQEIAADPLLLPPLNEALTALREVVAAGERTACEIIVRTSETYGYTVAALRGVGKPSADSDQALHALAGRWRAVCPSLAGVVIRSNPSAHRGAAFLVEELAGIAFHLQPTTFFQVNLASAEALLRLARESLALRPAGSQGLHSADRLLDLYCGAGAFALPLAAEVAEVLGIEEYDEAIADARTTAEEHAIANAHFELGQVERLLERIDSAFDAAILDPPRRGCHPRALAALLRLAPDRLVYVSCHPATLARDLKTLIAGGYLVASVQPVDLFPQTPHVESVSVLVRDRAADESIRAIAPAAVPPPSAI